MNRFQLLTLALAPGAPCHAHPRVRSSPATRGCPPWVLERLGGPSPPGSDRKQLGPVGLGYRRTNRRRPTLRVGHRVRRPVADRVSAATPAPPFQSLRRRTDVRPRFVCPAERRKWQRSTDESSGSTTPWSAGRLHVADECLDLGGERGQCGAGRRQGVGRRIGRGCFDAGPQRFPGRGDRLDLLGELRLGIVRQLVQVAVDGLELALELVEAARPPPRRCPSGRRTRTAAAPQKRRQQACPRHRQPTRRTTSRSPPPSGQVCVSWA